MVLLLLVLLRRVYLLQEIDHNSGILHLIEVVAEEEESNIGTILQMGP